MKKSATIIFFLVITFFGVASSSFAGAVSEGGLYSDSPLSIHVSEPTVAAHDHSVGTSLVGVEHDSSRPCNAIIDCGCFGCQRSEGAGAAFLSVAEAFVPASDAVFTRIFTTEDISIYSAALYADPHTSLPLRPPQGF